MNYLISIGTLKLSYLTQSTKQSIQSYINNNRYVIIHTDKVSVKGYKGAGYIAIDPTTGEGAYMISGGMNGSVFSVVEEIMFFLTAMFGESLNYILKYGLNEQASKLITSLIKPLVIGSLFIAFLNSYVSCSNIADVLIMTLIHSISLTAVLVLAGLFPPFGFMMAAVLSIILDFIVKPYIQEEWVCKR